MRRPTAILLLALASASFGLIGPELGQLLSVAQPDQQLMVHIVMKEQFDAELLNSMVDGLPRPERRMAVAQILQDFSAERQAGLLDCLQDAEAQGRVSSITSFWIVNAVYCEATPDVVMEVSTRTDVNYVDYDLRDVPDFPEPEEPGGEPEEVAWGVERISAPDVWAMGWTGAGIVCGHIDTGVDYTHPDLADHMWTDPYYPNHGWDFKNVDDNPMDEHSHGTHTAGTVASDGTSGTKCGVAPDAQIMALRVADGQQTSENHVWQAMEFCISPPLSPDNGADLYTMSLGWLMQWEPSRATWRTLSNNVNAAGLVQVTIVGNERGSVFPPNAVRCPGDVPPPWPNPQNTGTGGLSGIMSVGATNAGDECAGFSSPGPVTWQNVPGFEDYVYPPGLTRPDMSAPGVDIRTCRLGGGYASALGTSMAAPHVAGTVF